MERGIKRYTYAAVDAFTDAPLSGNPAGVVLLGDGEFPEEELCIAIAAELRYSETAFVRKLGEREFAVRYYTPACEAALCGHATVAVFTLLREPGGASLGDALVHTTAGDIRVTLEEDAVWLDMAEARTVFELDAETSAALYAAYGLAPRESVSGMRPKAVSVGLADIMLPVFCGDELARAKQDEAAVAGISQALGVTGVHMFCLTNDGFTAHTRNFAPLYGIPEECATGTASGGLFHYLSEYGLVGSEASFLQGEAMGRPSVIRARREKGAVRVGGSGAVLVLGELRV
jgi:PhzF family phenazine biosynthesis protein